MPPEAALVLYTDGLTEAKRDLEAGEARVNEILTADHVLLAEHPARALHDAVIDVPSRDDVAVLTVVSRPDDARGAIVRRRFDSADAAAARGARDAVRGALTEHGLSEDALAAAELLFAELLGNVVRYAGGTAEVALDLSAPAPVLHVLDGGPGFRHLPKLPADVLSEHGRGLYIVSALAEEFTVTRRPQGGSHARVVLGTRTAETPEPSALFPDLDTLAPLT